MQINKTRKNQKSGKKYLNFVFKKRRFSVLIDKVMFFRFLRQIHGRFWGITAIIGLLIGLSICFIIKPEALQADIALSEFGNDFRTSPFFTGSVFFAAYGLWRWRRYLSRTWQRSMPVAGLILLTILGLYLVALMPLGWRSIPYKIHLFGVSLAGSSMFATVILDSVLSKRYKRQKKLSWSLLHTMSISFIIIGAWVTFGSLEFMKIYNLSLVGEILMLLGYFVWIILKTYLGEGRRTLLSKLLKDFIIID